jgi:hypothetical protein
VTPDVILSQLLDPAVFGSLPAETKSLVWRLEIARARSSGWRAWISPSDRVRLEDLACVHLGPRLVKEQRTEAAAAARLDALVATTAAERAQVRHALAVARAEQRRRKWRAPSGAPVFWIYPTIAEVAECGQVLAWSPRPIVRAPEPEALEPEELSPCSCGLLASQCTGGAAHLHRQEGS